MAGLSRKRGKTRGVMGSPSHTLCPSMTRRLKVLLGEDQYWSARGPGRLLRGP
jgi:hypothetical protein